MIRVKAGPEIKYSYEKSLGVVDLLSTEVFDSMSCKGIPFFNRHRSSKYADYAVITRGVITNPKNKQEKILRWMSNGYEK